MTLLNIVATLPFLLHVMTSLGCMYRTPDEDTAVDGLEYWKNTFIDCYRLGPASGSYFSTAAYVQGILPVIALLLHLSSKLETRKLGYAILAALFFTTQLRLLIFEDGPVVIGYFYTHIFVFSVLVLYNDNYLTSNGSKS